VGEFRGIHDRSRRIGQLHEGDENTPSTRTGWWHGGCQNGKKRGAFPWLGGEATQ